MEPSCLLPEYRVVDGLRSRFSSLVAVLFENFRLPAAEFVHRGNIP